MIKWFLTKFQRQFNGERLVLLTNGAGIIGYAYAKKWTSINGWHHI